MPHPYDSQASLMHLFGRTLSLTIALLLTGCASAPAPAPAPTAPEAPVDPLAKFEGTRKAANNSFRLMLAPAGVEGVATENDDSLHVVSSPFVGTYYASPSPDASAYTGMGQTVAQGQTVCIVEAMKLMNEIESEVSGVVVEILVENGQGVQYGDPLFRIKVS